MVLVTLLYSVVGIGFSIHRCRSSQEARRVHLKRSQLCSDGNRRSRRRHHRKIDKSLDTRRNRCNGVATAESSHVVK